MVRELPTGGQNDDLGGVFVTSFGEGVHHVAPAWSLSQGGEVAGGSRFRVTPAAAPEQPETEQL
jgi:hypothetical protein